MNDAADKTMSDARPAPSPALRAANERLLALRAQLERQPDRSAATQTETTAADPSDPLDSADQLPAHLGWDSPAVTTAVRARQVASAVNGSEETTGTDYLDQFGAGSVEVAVSHSAPPPDPATAASTLQTSAKDQPTSSSLFPLPSSFPLHPTLALALLRQQQVAVGRLWLLLRLLDSEGRGWLSRADIEAAFADPDSPTHFCTPRYLRQLLAEGDGFYWEREESEKVWLRSQAKVAAALGVTKLRGRAVELPVSVLLGPIGDLRAHLYASFHSSRRGYSDGHCFTDEANPISRAALRELSGVSPRTQQSYDVRAKVEVQPCLAIGGLTSVASTQEAAWQQGRAAFTFTDHQGKQGAAGGRYQAHRLPNRYSGPHRCLTGRPKRLNRQLIDLCHKGYAGNGQLESEVDAAERRYYGDGVAAGRVWLRQQGRVLVYWQANSGMANGHRAGSRQSNNRQPAACFWYMLGTGAV